MADDFPANFLTSGTLVVGGVAAGAVETPNDEDWFAVELKAGRAYSFRASGAGDVLTMHDGAYGPTTWLPDDGSFIAPRSGTYYLAVGSATAGAYALCATTPADDIGNDENHPATLPMGAPVGGTIDFSADADFFQLHVEKDHLYRMTMTAAPGSPAGAKPYVDVLLGSHGAAISHGGDATHSTETFIARDSADLLARLSGPGAMPPFGYAVRFDDIGKDDFGNTAATAGRVFTASTVTGQMDGAGDVDAMRVSLPWGVTYQVKIGGSLANPPSQLVAGALLGSAPTDNGGIGTQTLTATAHPGEDVVFYVHDATGRSGAYTVAFVPAADDFSANGATTGRLAVGSSASGSFQSSADRDWFAVTLKAGVNYVFSSTAPARQLGVFGADGNRLSEPSVVHDDGVALGFTPKAAGTYYLEAATWTNNPGYAADVPGNYTVSAATALADDHPAPVLLTAGATARGAIGSGADVDTYRFDLQAGRHYSIDVTEQVDGQAALPHPVIVHRVGDDTPAGFIRLDDRATMLTPTTDGRYEVSFSKAQENLQSYTIGLVDHGIDDYPAMRDAPTDIPAGGLQGRIDTAGDVDTFRVRTWPGEKIAIVVRGAEGSDMPALAADNAVVTLGGVPAGYHTQSGAGAFRFVTVDADAAGTVDVSVAAHAGTGAYTLDVRHVYPGLSPALLNAQDARVGLSDNLRLHFGTPMAQLEDSGAGDWFTITDAAQHVFAHYASGDAAHVHWQDGDVVITPDVPWQPGQAYTLTASNPQFIDIAGDVVTLAPLRFTTAPLATGPDAGNGIFQGMHAGATIDGGAGLDTVVYGGAASGTTLQAHGNGSFTVTAPGVNTDLLNGIERVLFGGQRDAVALDVGGHGVGGEIYRLYQAAFNRTPDKGGIGYWMASMDQGTRLRDVARGFIDSAEYQHLYANAYRDLDFVNLLYKNVLHRDPDIPGRDYWLDAMADGLQRTDMLVAFSESAENVGALASIIGNGFGYTPYAG